MTVIEEVLSFTRDYINSESQRTPDKIRKIREAYKQLTGEEVKTSCQLCYIEILFKIRSIMEKKPCRYQLKPGALLQAFGDESKTCTNNNLTDELAEWHLKNNPGVRNLFSKVPELPWENPDAKIINPNKAEEARLLKEKTDADLKLKQEIADAKALEEANLLKERKAVEAKKIADEKKVEANRSHKKGAGNHFKTN